MSAQLLAVRVKILMLPSTDNEAPAGILEEFPSRRTRPAPTFRPVKGDHCITHNCLKIPEIRRQALCALTLCVPRGLEPCNLRG